MSRKASTLLIGLTTALLSAGAHANCTADACSSVLIDEIYIESGLYSSNIWIQTSGTETNLNCTPNSGVFLRLSDSMAQQKTVLASLLAAQSMDKPVFIRVAAGRRIV